MDDAEALVPKYLTRQVDLPITLYEGEMEAVHVGRGSIRLEWLPTPRLVFVVETETIEPIDVALTAPTPIPIGMSDISANTTGIITGTETRLGAPGVGSQVIRGFAHTISIGEDEALSRVQFHVPNFPSFIGGHIERRDGEGKAAWNGRLQVDDGTWSVTLDLVQNHRELMRDLRDVGGYALTAVGDLRRADQAAFSVSNAREILEMISYWLVFLAGQWTQPVLLVGYSASDEQVFEEWRSPRVDPWMARRSVFPEFIREKSRVREPNLRPTFGAMRKDWSDPILRDSLIWAISWLMDSGKAVSADTSLVLSQAGLELLAWDRLVVRGNMNARKFRNLEAYEAIARLLKHMNIDPRLPNGTMLNELHLFAKGFGGNGPRALTRVRNSIAHPRKGASRPSAQMRIEASRLGLWYLELAILRLLDYSDSYLNRLRSWHPERVPWVKK